MLLTKLTRYVRIQSGNALITVAFLVHMHQIAAQGLVLRLFVKIVSLSFRSFLSFQLAGQWKNMLNESFTQHMDAIKSCSTKQQFSIKVYLRDILHPYVFLDFLASTNLYFSFTFFNISSRCSNEIFYVESNHKDVCKMLFHSLVYRPRTQRQPFKLAPLPLQLLLYLRFSH